MQIRNVMMEVYQRLNTVSYILQAVARMNGNATMALVFRATLNAMEVYSAQTRQMNMIVPLLILVIYCYLCNILATYLQTIAIYEISSQHV